MNKQPDPSHIMQTATAFWASKVLLTGVELGLFSTLGDDSMTARQIGERLDIHPRGRFDFLDALVALNFLDREGDGPEGLYRNTPDTGAFLNKASPAYIGGLPEMLNKRLFGFWNDLGTALRTFLEAMTGFQLANFVELGKKFDFSRFNTVTDVGGALALLSRTVGSQYKHLVFNTFDLPPVAPLAQKQIDAAGMTDRITVISGDFFQGEFPKADVITMGNILHDWNLEKKKLLIQKAYDALPQGGAFIAVENLIDDARRENAFGLLMSLNMLIEFGDAFDYTAADFRDWCSEAGFSDFDVIPLAGPSSAAVAYKGR
jgi:hypothetical protein